jgi:hypothetical protein
MVRRRLLLPLLSLALFCCNFLIIGNPRPVQAGCGCQKPSPPPAAIFPNATYVGAPVMLLHSALQNGQLYTVTFTSTNGTAATVQTHAVNRRDIADGQYKPQLAVSLPNVPMGPTSITIQQNDGPIVTVLDDSFLTVVPQPVVVPNQVGQYTFSAFQTAVSREGVIYLSLDLTNVTMPMVFRAQAKGYPLRFTGQSAIFYNIQGYLMQLLDGSIPGLFSINAPNSTSDSDILQYSRHEFNTYFLQHEERQPHALDQTDPNWHVDGTPHVDHNHLILALTARLNDGSLPVPGVTPTFQLSLSLASLFHNGLVGATSVAMTGLASTDSYDSDNAIAGLFDSQADLLSKTITLNQFAVVNGNTTSSALTVAKTARVTGKKSITKQPIEFMPVLIPQLLPDLGRLTLGLGAIRTLGPGSYKVSDLVINGGSLIIKNDDGPVTLYVTGRVSISVGSISVTNKDPESFAVYVAGGGEVTLGLLSHFYGVVYAPQSPMNIFGLGQFYGAFVGNTVTVRDAATIHYDSALRKASTSRGSGLQGLLPLDVFPRLLP